MSWFRLGWAKYPSNKHAERQVFVPASEWPTYVALEASKPTAPYSSVNLVYYKDEALTDFVNDDAFESLEDAFLFCSEELDLQRCDFHMFQDAIELY